VSKLLKQFKTQQIMITANIRMTKSIITGKAFPYPVYGTITADYEGNYSLSITDARNRTYAEKSHMQQLAKEVVKSNYKHETVVSCYGVISKADTKRFKSERRDLTVKLEKEFIQFKNDYIKSFIDFNVKMQQLILDKLSNSDDSSEIQIQIQQEKMNRVTLMHLEYGKEAEAAYNQKFNKMIDELCDNKMSSYRLESTRIASEKANEFSYEFKSVNWKTGEDITLHARFTVVDGHYRSNQVHAGMHYVSPHYRFIITTRKS